MLSACRAGFAIDAFAFPFRSLDVYAWRGIRWREDSIEDDSGRVTQ
jgi:hypothetical protein